MFSYKRLLKFVVCRSTYICAYFSLLTGSAVVVVSSTNCTNYTFQIESKCPRTAQGQDDLNRRKIDYNVNLRSDSTVVEREIPGAPKLRPPVNISYTVSIFRIP